MKFRTIGKTGIEASVLGLGCMRLPMTQGEKPQIDDVEATELLRYAIDHGVNYIDTAYPYHDGESELFLGKALKDGYRERVTLITKSPGWLIQTQADFHRLLDEQLEKLQSTHVDIYLLHALNRTTWDMFKSIDVFSAIEEAKRLGKIKHIGFSFHDKFEVFEEIINAYDWEVCMLQLNYMDMHEQAGLKGLELAASKGVPVIVMEPLKGGMLATPSDDIKAIWDTYPVKRSPVEWAMRYVANFENVKVVLSGMSTLEQLKENIQIAERLEVNNLDEAGLACVEKVREAYASRVQVPCTQCKYCVPCPQGVEIPRVFTHYNRAHIFNAIETMRSQYQSQFKTEAKASRCVACGLCEPKCPQNIAIIKQLEKVTEVFGA